MKTVKQMKEELAKFPDNAECYGYEGEACGLGIKLKGKYGFIHCSERNGKESETELFKVKTK